MLIYDEGVRISKLLLLLSQVRHITFHYRAKNDSRPFKKIEFFLAGQKVNRPDEESLGFYVLEAI